MRCSGLDAVRLEKGGLFLWLASASAAVLEPLECPDTLTRADVHCELDHTTAPHSQYEQGQDQKPKKEAEIAGGLGKVFGLHFGVQVLFSSASTVGIPPSQMTDGTSFNCVRQGKTETERLWASIERCPADPVGTWPHPESVCAQWGWVARHPACKPTLCGQGWRVAEGPIDRG